MHEIGRYGGRGWQGAVNYGMVWQLGKKELS